MPQFRHIRFGLLAVFLPLSFLLEAAGCSGPPALESEEAYSTADALYTAITSRRTDLLDGSETRLRELNTNGRISAEALASLTEIIEQARAGSWQDAAEELDGFIRHQPQARHSH
jgi:hypothetical protein